MKHVVKIITASASAALLKAALFLLHASASCSADCARTAVQLGVINSLCERLEAVDPAIKADAVWCLAALARHDATLGVAVADSPALHLIGRCLKVGLSISQTNRQAAPPACPSIL